jgi:rsbT co-antagonist protein RsbR
VVGAVLDITERRRAEEEQRRLQDELIEAQERVLLDLSTPCIPLNDWLMVMPIVGEMDLKRAHRVMERLLESIAKSRTRVAILDVTGMPSISAQVAHALVRCARAVRMVGSQMLLTGIRADVAQTLVSIGVDLTGIVTCATLQAGISHASLPPRSRRSLA